MKYQYISLFSGAGGLDLGLEKAGLQAISLCELESKFCETLKNNQVISHGGHTPFRGAEIINDDIRNLKGSDLACGQTIDLVVGGPPCQAFSSSGRQLSVLDSRGGSAI